MTLARWHSDRIGTLWLGLRDSHPCRVQGAKLGTLEEGGPRDLHPGRVRLKYRFGICQGIPPQKGCGLRTLFTVSVPGLPLVVAVRRPRKTMLEPFSEHPGGVPQGFAFFPRSLVNGFVQALLLPLPLV